MKKILLLISLCLMVTLPALSFSAVRISIGFPIQIGSGYPSPQVLQGTLIQSAPGTLALRCADGSEQLVYLTDQTQVNGALVLGAPVSVNAYPANGMWYAQSVNAVYNNYSNYYNPYSYPAPAPYPYAYPSPYPYNYYPRSYSYRPGFINFGFGFGGHEGGHRGDHEHHDRH